MHWLLIIYIVGGIITALLAIAFYVMSRNMLRDEDLDESKIPTFIQNCIVVGLWPIVWVYTLIEIVRGYKNYE